MSLIETADLQPQDFLNAIARTKLLFKSDKEMCKALGYSESTKNIGRIGGTNPIIKDAVLAYLDIEYAKMTSQDINLRSMIEDYVEATRYVLKFRRQKYFSENKDRYAALIEHFCTGRTTCTDSQILADMKEMEKNVGLDNYILPIMLLILWKIIPVFNTKKQCDIKDIYEEAYHMLDIVEEIIKASDNLRRYPIIDRIRNDFKECSSPSRLKIIHSLSVILIVLYNNSSPDRMLCVMDEYPWGELDINGYWEDIDHESIWHFESEDNCTYRVKHLVKDANDNEYHRYYRTYEMYILDSKEYNTYGLFVPTEALRSLIAGGKLPEEMQVVAAIDLPSEQDAPIKIEISCCADNEWFNNCKLRKVINADRCRTQLENSISWCNNVDHEIVDNAYAITEDHIYFRKPDSELFYKIPGELFDNTDLYDLYMYKSKEFLFVGCPMTLKYVDITDEERMKRNGISIVDRIK